MKIKYILGLLKVNFMFYIVHKWAYYGSNWFERILLKKQYEEFLKFREERRKNIFYEGNKCH